MRGIIRRRSAVCPQSRNAAKMFRRLLLLAVVCSLGLTELPGKGAGWTQNQFLVTFWCPPPATDENLARVSAEGFNLTWTPVEGLEVAARHGLRAMLTSDLLNPATLDRALLIFVEVTLDRTSSGAFEQFAAAVRRSPEIMECHMVAGGFDYLIKVRVRDVAAYRTFLGETLVSLPGIRQTHTYTVMEEVKNSDDIPI